MIMVYIEGTNLQQLTLTLSKEFFFLSFHIPRPHLNFREKFCFSQLTRLSNKQIKQSSHSLLFHSTIIRCINASCTVEPRRTTKLLIRPPLYYEHFFVARAKAHTFSDMKTPLIRPAEVFAVRIL